jgi:hypothetical protein
MFRKKTWLVLAVLALVGAGMLVRYPGLFPRRVTLAELERETKDYAYLNYCGTEGKDHVFETVAGRVYLVSRDELKGLEPPLFTFEKGEQGVRMHVMVKDGKVGVPDPQKLAEWEKNHPQAAPNAPPAAGAVVKELPVVRHDTSPEPKVLVLWSGGDWTDQDIGRLDGVLEDWLETEAPDRKDAKSQADEARPWLRSDPARSTPERMSVVIQARHFKNAWCEALGARLAKEYPFLWQLEVGEPLGSDAPAEWDDTFISVPRKTLTLDDGSQVVVEPFEIARHPVSFEQFFKFVSATGHATTAELKKSEKTFLTPTGPDEPVARADRTLPVSLVSYQDAVAYCEWAGVRLPTEDEYLAAMILDDRIFPRGHADAARLQEELFLSPRALRGTWLNFTSTTAPDGRVVCRYGPLMLRYQGVALTDPKSRMILAPDHFSGGVAIRVCKKKPGAK